MLKRLHQSDGRDCRAGAAACTAVCVSRERVLRLPDSRRRLYRLSVTPPPAPLPFEPPLLPPPLQHCYLLSELISDSSRWLVDLSWLKVFEVFQAVVRSHCVSQ